VMIDNGNPDNHGEKRYLQKVLLKGAGALRQTGAEGTVTYFECETDPARIGDNFPVLKELCDRIRKLDPGEAFSVGPFLDEMQKPPYGAGGNALALALAHMIRAYGERLIVYKDSTRMARESIADYSDIVDILSDPAPKTVLEVRQISPAQRSLLEEMAKAVDAPALKHGQTRTLNEAYAALSSWWKHLPEIAKVTALYSSDKRPVLQKLKELLDGLGSTVDPFTLMLKELPAALNEGYEGQGLPEAEAAEMGVTFRDAVKQFNSGEQTARDLLAKAVCRVFGTDGDLVVCEKTATEWYEGLSAGQRNPNKYEDDASFLLTRLGDTSKTFGKKLTGLLPKDFGFGEMDSWSALHMEDFAAKLKQAKEEIEKARPEVSKPDVPEGAKEVLDKEELWAKVPKGAKAVVYTLDGTDPRYSEQALKTDADLNLSGLLKDRPGIRVKLRAVDTDGNYSEPVDVELVSKTRKYNIQVKGSLFGEEATFKCPSDKEGLAAVITSVLQYAVKKELISPEAAKEVEGALGKL
jgi:hypothetical protein